MNLRESLSERAAPGRVALVSTVLFVFGSLVGCSATVSEENVDQGLAHPGKAAAMIADARALDFTDEIARLKQEQHELDGKRSDCLMLAADYRAKSAGVWSDPSLSEKERPALADQYDTIASESEEKAFRYGQASEVCATQISLLADERYDRSLRARSYESMMIPLTELQ